MIDACKNFNALGFQERFKLLDRLCNWMATDEVNNTSLALIVGLVGAMRTGRDLRLPSRLYDSAHDSSQALFEMQSRDGYAH